ncbi:MAG: porin family protein [Kordiimonadaceae bacterium]|jgi:outer membrane immunogenic protein|nr:porin family protein [Kordiimonadaceae bacterium]MBT6037571.1 porin family protein [Kordiimonadaceae bacterium]MBT7581395.1 porin family protein [Kordiimonadaceae bacterium]
MTLKRTKYIISSAVIALISLYNMTASAGVDGSPFEGMYAGVITTKSTFSSGIIHLARPTDDEVSIFGDITNTKSSNSYGMGILGGYGLNYGIFYGGAEAAFIVDKGNTVFSDGTNTIKVSQSNTFDFSFRPGITLSNKALIFGLVGYSGTNIKSSGINKYQDSGDNGRYNKRLTSLRFGGGIEVAVMENIAVRAEYTRSIIGEGLYVDRGDQFTFKPKTSRIMLSFVLHMY